MLKPCGTLAYDVVIQPASSVQVACMVNDDLYGHKFGAGLIFFEPGNFAGQPVIEINFLKMAAPAVVTGPFVTYSTSTDIVGPGAKLTSLVVNLENRDAAVLVSGRVFVRIWNAANFAK